MPTADAASARPVAFLTRVSGGVRYFLLETDIQTAEVFCAGANLWWVIVLSVPQSWWDFIAPHGDEKRQVLVDGLRVVVGERIWLFASVLALCVALRAAVAGIRGVCVCRARRLALQVYFYYYLTIAIAIAAANPRSTGLGVYFMLALCAAWGFLRLGPRAREQTDALRLC